jgi:hypothetical protein
MKNLLRSREIDSLFGIGWIAEIVGEIFSPCVRDWRTGLTPHRNDIVAARCAQSREVSAGEPARSRY